MPFWFHAWVLHNPPLKLIVASETSNPHKTFSSSFIFPNGRFIPTDKTDKRIMKFRSNLELELYYICFSGIPRFPSQAFSGLWQPLTLVLLSSFWLKHYSMWGFHCQFFSSINFLRSFSAHSPVPLFLTWWFMPLIGVFFFIIWNATWLRIFVFVFSGFIDRLSLFCLQLFYSLGLGF